MNSWGPPPDAVAWVALALGIGLVVVAALERVRPAALRSSGPGLVARALLAPRASMFVATASAVSAALSWGYFHFYLVGGPRIIDATSYLQEARLFARGLLEFVPDGPAASFHSRFLLSTANGGLTPLFPPGYPLILSLGVALGAPFAVGPVLAAVLVWLSYTYAKCAFEDELSARVTACLSCLCAVLRYHTADTMSHGLCAVWVLGALIAVARATAERSDSHPRVLYWALLSGLCWSLLFATRPVSALALTLPLLFSYRADVRAAIWCALGAIPCAALFLWQQQLLTGHWGTWAQHAYYAAADGPPGCIRLGFGSDIGCRIEHGVFVDRYLPHGYGPLEALYTTGRRLALHLGDAGNSRWVMLLLPFGLWWSRRNRHAQLIGLLLGAQVVTYALFYFDGNLPGAGARMFADVLPLEHVLIALGAVRLRAVTAAVAATLLGFALHGAASHQQLRQQQGGRPMFEPERVPDDVELLFMDTDHGFNLAFGSNERRVVARARADAYDRALWEHLGRPKTAVYDFDLNAKRPARLVPFIPSTYWRFEAESAWPASWIRGGWIEPVYVLDACTSEGRLLQLHPSASERLALQVELWVPAAGRYRIDVGGRGPIEFAGIDTHWTAWSRQCPGWQSDVVTLAAGALRLTVNTGTEAVLDAFELVPMP